MKHLCLVLSSILFAGTVFAQSIDTSFVKDIKPAVQSENYKKFFNTWSVGMGAGMSQYYGDVKEYDWYPAKQGAFKEMRYAGHLTIHKALNNVYGLQVEFLKGGIAGIRKQGGGCDGCNPSHNPEVDTISIKFEGDYWMGGISTTFNLSNLFISGKATQMESTRKWTFIGKAGVGRMFYRTVRTELASDLILRNPSGEALYRGYDDLNRTVLIASELEEKARVDETIFFAGVSAKYRFTDRLDLEFGVNRINSQTDRLDGDGENRGETNDHIVYSSFGLVYKLGKKKQSLEWYSPLDEVYRSYSDVNVKIEGMMNDSDGDGVADQFDQNPNTPDGVAVDGSGNALDVDMDGVADYLDADPFTAKGAAVDAMGNELDSDGDGVPDSRDLEVNTEEGDLVNYQGLSISGTGGVSTSFLPSIYFSSAGSNLRQDNFKQLAAVALTLRNNPDLRLLVVGHTDSHGEVYYNDELGMRRANTVVAHLIEVYGIDGSRLEAETRGETMPLALTPAIQVEIEGRGITFEDYLTEINRRVDFEIAE
ncbi:MAG: OmpA family protein [Bacteroidetes bacterium]|nr:OmpA family protein [Bacteroidota bacterium]